LDIFQQNDKNDYIILGRIPSLGCNNKHLYNLDEKPGTDKWIESNASIKETMGVFVDALVNHRTLSLYEKIKIIENHGKNWSEFKQIHNYAPYIENKINEKICTERLECVWNQLINSYPCVEENDNINDLVKLLNIDDNDLANNNIISAEENPNIQ